MDLLENYELLPKEIINILDSFDENIDAYKECRRITNEFKPLGFSIEYGLCGTLYDLKKVNSKTLFIQLILTSCSQLIAYQEEKHLPT